MRIALINPSRFKKMPVGREDRCENTIPNILPPTGLVYLATLLLDRGHDVNLIDANGYDLSLEDVKKILIKNKPDFVVFRATPETFFEDIKVADVAKSLDGNLKTAMICWTLSYIPEEVISKSDNLDYYITDFYYERPIMELAENFDPENIPGVSYKENGEVINNPPSKEAYEFDLLPKPAWDLIPDFNLYWTQVPSTSPWTFIISMKGCGMNCSFCAITEIKPKFRPEKKVVDEIEYLVNERNLKYLSFFDSTFNINRKRLFRMCDEIIDRDLNQHFKWFANVRADIKEDEASKMAEAGCKGVSVGIESGSQKVLDLANKKTTVEQAAETIKNLKKEGIKQYASFIVGLPGETLETMDQTKRFILKTKPTGFQVNSLVPYSRSKVYDLAVEQGLMEELQFDNLLLYNSPISLCELSVDEINDFRRKIYADVYKNPGWWMSNIKEVIKNPEDIHMGLDYTKRVFKRLIRGVNSEN